MLQSPKIVNGMRLLKLDVRPGERAAAIYLFLGHFLLIAFLIAAKSVRQATFLDTLGAAGLPLVYLLVALCSYPLLGLYSRLVDRHRRHHVVVGTFSFFALSMAVFWWLFRFPWLWVSVLFYVWASLAFVMTVSQFWSYADQVLDTRQARRLFGLIGAGALLGSIAGGQAARLTTELSGTHDSLLVAAVALIGAAGALLRVHHLYHLDIEGRRASSLELGQARGGLEVIRRSRHLQLIGLVVALGVVVAQIVDLQFNWAMEQASTSLDQSTVFFGNFYSVMGIAAFLFQVLFAAPIQRYLGVGFAMRVLPVTMALATGSLLVAGAVLPFALFGSALSLKIGEIGLRYSLDRSTRELLFLPVPAAARLKAKAYIDIFVARGAKGLAGILLLPVTFGVLGEVEVGWLTLALIALWLAVISALKREYVRSFRSRLKLREIDATSPINVSDVTTLEILMQSLGSDDPRLVLNSLWLLAGHDRGMLVPPHLLYHDDFRVRLKTLQILADTERGEALHLIERRLSDDHPEVRAEAIRALAALHREDACTLMLPRIGDPEPAVRAAAIACLANYGEASMLASAQVALRELLSDTMPRVRREAAKALGAIKEPVFSDRLVGLHYDPDLEVVREALAAVRTRVTRDGASDRYLPTLVALLNHSRLKHDAREALVALGESAIPSLIHFMTDPDEEAWVRRAIPKTVARIGSEAAIDALVGCLGSSGDPFLRGKIIEALASMQVGRVKNRHRSRVEAETGAEARRYLQCLTDLLALTGDQPPLFAGPQLRWDEDKDDPGLLEDLMAIRANGHLRNLFGLLAVLYRSRDISAAYRGLVGNRPSRRSHALEFLENTVEGELKRVLFAVIDDSPVAERLYQAERSMVIKRRGPSDVLKTILQAACPEDPDAYTLPMAAIYWIYTEGASELHDEVARLSRSAKEPRIRETALWVARRLKLIDM